MDTSRILLCYRLQQDLSSIPQATSIRYFIHRGLQSPRRKVQYRCKLHICSPASSDNGDSLQWSEPFFSVRIDTSSRTKARLQSKSQHSSNLSGLQREQITRVLSGDARARNDEAREKITPPSKLRPFLRWPWLINSRSNVGRMSAWSIYKLERGHHLQRIWSLSQIQPPLALYVPVIFKL